MLPDSKRKSEYRCFPTLVVDSIQQWETLPKFVHSGHVSKTKYSGDVLNWSLARYKNMFVEELSEHAQRTVRHYHLLCFYLSIRHNHAAQPYETVSTMTYTEVIIVKKKYFQKMGNATEHLRKVHMVFD